MSLSRRTFAALSFALAVVAFGCAATDVVIADVPAASDVDGGMVAPGAPCTAQSDCPGSQFCDKATCLAPTGKCRPRPAICEPDGPPVCGCDGVTYWNDCLRRAAGITAGEHGQCLVGATCGGPAGETCPSADATCAHVAPGPDACAPDAPGTCWVLPSTCPTDLSNGGWAPCAKQHGTCVDLCTAIRSAAPYHRAEGPGCP